MRRWMFLSCFACMIIFWSTPSLVFAADEDAASTLVAADMAYVAFAALMVFFMTPTLGVFYGGMVRR